MSQASEVTLIVSIEPDPSVNLLKRLSQTFNNPPATKTADEQVRTRVAYTGEADDAVKQHSFLQTKIWDSRRADPSALVNATDVHSKIVEVLRACGKKTENVLFVTSTDFQSLDSKVGLDTGKVRSGAYGAYPLSDEQFTQLEKELKGTRFSEWNPSILGGLFTVES